MEPATAALLAAAGFAAGAVNAVAGGGSLISFPALLAAGHAPIAANVTNAVALVPGYVGGSVAYRRELAGQGGRIRTLAVTSTLGATAGTALLLVGPESVFEAIVPWLILGACALLVLQPRAAVLAQRARDAQHHRGAAVALHLALFAATLYGGYFGAGLGIVLLAVLGVFLADEFQRLNALKGVLSLLVAVVSTAAFVAFGPIAWGAAAVVGAAALAGGTAGVHAARKLPAATLRGIVVAYGVCVALVMLVG